MSNIITIKLKLRYNIADNIREFQQKYSNVVRYAFNRFMEDYSRTQIFYLIKTLNNVDELDITWRREAVKIAESLALAIKKKNEDEQKVIFGGKANFYKRLKGKISHKEFVENRKLFYISCEGSKSDNKGNRKFKFDFDSLSGSVKLNNKMVFFSCYSQNRNNMSILKQALMLAESNEIGLTYRLNADYFYICVDLDKLTFDRYEVCKDTTLAIDMNPNYIGLCIINPNNKIIHKQVYDLSKIHENGNKRDYELTQIAISIAKLCKHYKVEMVGYEKLKIENSDKKKGKRFNKQVNNDWHRGVFVNSLHKWLGLVNCKWIEIVPEYSSYIGCIMYKNETDCIAASMELNRRLREYKSMFIDKAKSKSSVIYPLFTMSHFNRWKESLGDRVFNDWKESYQWFKETRHSYRLTYPLWLKRNGIRPLRYKSIKSMIFHIII